MQSVLTMCSTCTAAAHKKKKSIKKKQSDSYIVKQAIFYNPNKLPICRSHTCRTFSHTHGPWTEVWHKLISSASLWWGLVVVLLQFLVGNGYHTCGYHQKIAQNSNHARTSQTQQRGGPKESDQEECPQTTQKELLSPQHTTACLKTEEASLSNSTIPNCGKKHNLKQRKNTT